MWLEENISSRNYAGRPSISGYVSMQGALMLQSVPAGNCVINVIIFQGNVHVLERSLNHAITTTATVYTYKQGVTSLESLGDLILSMLAGWLP